MEDGTAVCVAAELSTDRRAYERYPENFLGMLHLACWLILLRVFMG
jgi:hypothetical protein